MSTRLRAQGEESSALRMTKARRVINLFNILHIPAIVFQLSVCAGPVVPALAVGAGTDGVSGGPPRQRARTLAGQANTGARSRYAIAHTYMQMLRVTVGRVHFWRGAPILLPYTCPPTSPPRARMTPNLDPLSQCSLCVGCGLVGLCAASLGAHATLTDLACVLPVLEHHLRLNSSVIRDAGGQVDCHTLHWGRDEDLNGLPRFDLIVAADVRPIQCGRELS